MFAATRSGMPGKRFTVTAAAEYLRNVCKVASRKDLDTDAQASGAFANLRTEFDAWRGKIPAQR